MKIEKDNILKQWVVWEVRRNSKWQLYQAKTKKECKQWIERKNKK